MKKLIFLLLLAPIALTAQNTDILPYIEVTGNAEDDVEPNKVVLSLSVSENENIKKESNTVAMENKISAFLKSIGTDPANFVVDKYNTNERYTIISGKNVTIKKYYKLTILNLSLLDTIITKCSEVGMDKISIFKIENTSIDSINNILLASAAKNARQKADAIASALGVSISNIQIVNANHFVEPNIVNANNFKMEKMLFSSEDAATGRTSSSLGLNKIHLNASVFIRFGIKQ
ncbi:MAG TPA: SIMPL domain-containing protein [Bacteroidales bacterium]|nr:SIMPL domain-containing protein [Bacteroidales bacterium]